MIRPRYLSDSIVAQLVSVAAFLHSLGQKNRQEGCVWMAKKLAGWPSKRGPITKIRPSDGCGWDAVPLAMERANLSAGSAIPDEALNNT